MYGVRIIRARHMDAVHCHRVLLRRFLRRCIQDELCQFCVMDTQSPYESAKREAANGSCASVSGDRGEEGDVEENGASDNEQTDMPPTPDTVPITTSTAAAMQETCDEIDAADTVQIESQNTEKSSDGLRTCEFVKNCCGSTEEAASFNT